MKGVNLSWTVGVLTVILFVAFGVKTHHANQEPTQPIAQVQPPEVIPEPPKTPRLPNITVQVPPHLSYSEVVTQVKKWEQEAPDLVEVGFYGKTKRGLKEKEHQF